MFGFLWFAVAPLGVRGHPDLDEQIAALTARIQKGPANAELLLRRSQAYRLHAEFGLAFDDIAAAARLAPGWSKVLCVRASTWYDAGQPDKAMTAVREFLEFEPSHADGLLLRARCHVKLGQPARAVPDYSAALKAFAEPSPDLFVERARLQAALGHPGEAVKGLDDGLARLGPAPALQQLAIEYQRQQGDFDGALARVQTLLAQAPVKEPLLVLQAEVLEQAGRLVEARIAFQAAVHNIAALPAARRSVPAIRLLEARARDGLRRVEAKLPGSAMASKGPAS